MNETGGDFILMAVRRSLPFVCTSPTQSPTQHEDVHRIVHDLAASVGVRISFGAQVTEVTPGSPRPSVTLTSGEVIEADIVIGCDGPRSLVRPVVVGEDEGEPEVEGVTVFGATVPEAWMDTHPTLSKLVRSKAVRPIPALVSRIAR